MQDYAAQVEPQDRWAIAAYIRVLQFAHHAPADALTPDDRARLDQPASAPAGAREGEASAHE
jgi:hypothetical protein